MKTGISQQLETLKQNVLDSIMVNDDAVCSICDEIIALAKVNDDLQSIAFGYVWKADHYFYIHADIKQMIALLNIAELYIDTKRPSELLEKYYVLMHLYYESTFDTKKNFQMSLKALEVSESLGLDFRIGVNYGNIATSYSEYGNCEASLKYLKKSISIIRSLAEPKPRVLRLLLRNFISLYSWLNHSDKVLPYIHELENLPIEENDLKVYVDSAYMLYYSAKKDYEKATFYYEESKKHGLFEIPNHLFMIEFLSNMVEAMIYIENFDKAKESVRYLESIILEGEDQPLLNLCKLKIKYYRELDQLENLHQLYREFYILYLKVDENTREMKLGGLLNKVRLDIVNLNYNESRNKLKELESIVNIDELTKVYNRRYLNIKQDELINCKQERIVSIVIFDVDFFKEYNDFYGHQEGDKVLVEVASCLQKNAKNNMLIARYGGDEFICLSWDISIEEVKGFIDHAVHSLKEVGMEHKKSRCADYISLSIGYGTATIYKKTDMMTLFEHVDDALYEAKKAGRDCVRFYTDRELEIDNG